MRNANVVKKEDLISIYGNTLNAVDSSNRQQTDNLLNFPSDEFEVEVLATTGPFSMVLASNIRNSQRFMIPKEIIKNKRIPYAKDSFKPVLDRMMGPGNYYDDSNDTGYLYLRYPQLTITNSLGIVHNIEDLVVIINFDYIRGKLTGLSGRRWAWTKEELHYGYSHSHLSTSIGRFQDFCQGGNSIFAKFMAGMNKTNTPEEFELFLAQLKEYLSWESVEGRPYRWIGEIKNPGSNYGGEGGHDLGEAQRILCERLATIIVLNLHNFPEMMTVHSSGQPLFMPHNSNLIKMEKDHPLMRIESAFIVENLPSLIRYIEDWSWQDKTYKRPSNAIESQPPRAVDTTSQRVENRLGLTTRLITQPEDTQVTSKLVKRLNNRMWKETTYKVNRLLINALNKTNGNRNSVTTQAESDNQQGVSSPDRILA